MRYRVTWETDVEADNPTDAAQKARAIQADPLTQEICFTVLWFDDENCGQVDIDLHPTTELKPYDSKRN